MKEIIGRVTEKQLLEQTLKADEAELIAMYGRRRVGKTYLIRKTFQKQLIFEFSGIHNAPLKEQLTNFRNTIAPLLKLSIPLPVPLNWTEAFLILKNYAEPLLKKNKCVIFLDEFPWLSSPKSGFLSAFEFFWNSWGTKQNNLIVTICGSAASWMIQKVVNNKGGLHNRITKKIRLLPFTLAETSDYLNNNNVNLDQYQITQLYMALGGIPQYLKEIAPGQSAAQNIDRICFTKDGALQGEFNNLYQSLFSEADKHVAIVKALAAKPAGLTRKEIIAACHLSTGGTTTLLLQELTESGFISAYLPFAKNTRDSIYKLSDEYSRFYLKFIENSRATGTGTWIKLSAAPSWGSWSGTAFESICLKHTREIKAALGIAGVYTEESAWRHVPGKKQPGAQIDLLFDRQDFCISICEIKFSNTVFTIDKAYAAELVQKCEVFKSNTKTSKTLFIVMVTTFGTQDNSYKTGLVQNDIVLQDLFR
ncbi:AAA family ATPase [Mucilaginibacter ginsenosidivorax]|uniref:AAA family ATPase n=1 Tax=Mucilaginibacter ginsenosidivorax TaxID=862126 RepID=A0A5B8W727_9SPHI|nr:ATP-binding protein [Mucilaginibacter ginsenosidivorax]QEC78726.1 AAA family ATPase [Mucilaginibacter ginsenosidivorax]